jgi:hypothetical protein
MKILPIACFAGGIWLQAQVPTPINVLESVGSQANSLRACLIVSAANLQAPGYAPVPFIFVMSFLSGSRTLAYTCPAGATVPSAGSATINVTLEGTANAPFILAVSVVPGSRPCGGPQFVPCMATPTLFSSTASPFGIYHLGASPILVLDGVSPGPNPGSISPQGSYPLNATVPIGTAANGGIEQRFGVQALVADPTAPAGFTLSACFNLDQWVAQP